MAYGTPEKIKEAGEFFEEIIFGEKLTDIIHYISEEEAKAIIDVDSWGDLTQFKDFTKLWRERLTAA
jgi:hypothetical protein